jgi:O-antigen/teichoic acid export membrane protein
VALQLRGNPVAGRLLGFSGLSLLSAIGPLALLPLVARVSGQAEWAALGIGQSVGAFLALPVLFGWNLVGPTRAARAAAAERSVLYRQSLVVRLLVFAGCLPVGIVAASVLAPAGSETLAATMTVSVMLVGLSPAWFCVGVGRPAWLALYDAGPRLLATLLAIPLVLLTGSVFPYPVGVGLATAAGALAFTWRHRPLTDERWPSLRQSVRAGATDIGPAATVTIAGAYSAAPVAIAGAVLPVGPLAEFVSAERIYRFALVTVTTLSDSVQGWVSEVHGRHSLRRGTAALAAHAGLGLAGLATIALLGPWLSAVLFGEDLAVGRATFVGFGVAFLAISLNTSLGKHLLVPIGRTGIVLLSTVVGAVIGVASIAVFGHLYGAPGAAAAFAVSEVAVTAVQVVAYLMAIRTVRRAPVSPN